MATLIYRHPQPNDPGYEVTATAARKGALTHLTITSVVPGSARTLPYTLLSLNLPDEGVEALVRELKEA